MQLQDNDFTIFQLPQRMQQDADAIDARWKALQRETHPDRFAAQGSAAQRLAIQWSARINQARMRLKDPLARASYLCELAGFNIGAEDNTAMPADFLMQQMQWHEALDDAEDAASLQALAEEVQQEQNEALQQLQRNIDDERDFDAAVQQVRRLMFLNRIAQNVQNKQNAL